MGLAGALMIAWAGGIKEGTVPPYLIKGAFPACPNDRVVTDEVEKVPAIQTQKQPFVASKRGSKYYPADCPAAANLSLKNRIGFSSEDEARAAGYTLATTC